MNERIDVPGCNTGINFTYAFKTGTQNAWNSTNSGTWVADNYNKAWTLWGNIWSGYLAKVESLTSTGQYSYTASNGDPTVIYNISINPSITASTFPTS